MDTMYRPSFTIIILFTIVEKGFLLLIVTLGHL